MKKKTIWVSKDDQYNIGRVDIWRVKPTKEGCVFKGPMSKYIGKTDDRLFKSVRDGQCKCFELKEIK